jgi:hypothetical protein
LKVSLKNLEDIPYLRYGSLPCSTTGGWIGNDEVFRHPLTSWAIVAQLSVDDQVCWL